MKTRAVAAGRVAFVAEPPPQYVTRPAVVADCSMVCALLFDEPERAEAERLMSGRRLVAPALLDCEFANVALKKLRRGLAATVVERALSDYDSQRIELVGVEPLALFELARRYELTAYDAAYLELAARLKVPLFTFDHRLGSAAATHLRQLD